MVAAELRELINYRDLLRNLVVRDLTVRYKRSVLGFFWTMLYPLVNTLVFTFVFSTIFRFTMKDFIIYFLSGYQLWNFFSQSTTLAGRSILSNSSILKKVYVPRSVFVVSIVLSEMVNFGLSLLVLLLLLIFLGKGWSPALLFLPVPIVLTAIFTLGVSLILAASTVFFNDIMDIYNLLLMPWMFLTPIIYPLDIVPSQFLPFIKANPMYHLVECFRAPIYLGTLPDPANFVGAVAVALVMVMAGYHLFVKCADDFIYYI